MKDKEHWMELCQQAAVEQDPKRLMEFVEEINRENAGTFLMWYDTFYLSALTLLGGPA